MQTSRAHENHTYFANSSECRSLCELSAAVVFVVRHILGTYSQHSMPPSRNETLIQVGAFIALYEELSYVSDRPLPDDEMRGPWNRGRFMYPGRRRKAA
jgi:hypothetical protein